MSIGDLLLHLSKVIIYRFKTALTLLFVVGVVLQISLGPVPVEARALELKDYLDLNSLTRNGGDAHISPDGKFVIYTRVSVNVKKDRFVGEVWIVEVDGGNSRRLFDEAASAIAWSPDSQKIAYVVKAESGNSEIFVRDMRNDSVVQLTHESNTPSHLSWSPDGKWIAFRALIPESSTWDIEIPWKPEGADWAKDATVIDRLHWRKSEMGILPQVRSHIFIVPATGGEPRQLTYGDWQVGSWWAGIVDVSENLEWSPDSKSLIFSADQEGGSDLVMAKSSLYEVDVKTGALSRITSSPEFVIKPKVSPDGKHIVYLGMDDTSASNFPTPKLHVINRDGTDDRVLVDDTSDFHLFKMHWANDGLGIYYSHAKGGAFNVHYASLDGTVRDITSGAQNLSLTSISNDGIGVGTLSTAESPGDIVLYDLATGSGMRRLTALNDNLLKDIELGRVEEIWYDSSDNMRIQGWIVYPPNFDADKKFPLVLAIHGGPEGMYTGDFSFEFQEWAAQGYVVLYVNPRGSIGYGSEFARAIYNSYPGKGDFDDLMRGVDTVLSRGFIDENRLYVTGCSGGGTLTAWVVAQTDRFAGAAALCPIVNMISFAGASDFPVFAHNKFKEPFWLDPESWLEHSSIMHVDKVQTPTLVMIGENDLRTPVGQSEEFYTALKMRGVPTKLILLKEEGHATWLLQGGRPSNVLRSQLYLRKWFGEWQHTEVEDGTNRQSSEKKDIGKAETVILQTVLGDITIMLYPKRAPITVANFLTYVNRGYYDGASFYRAVRDDNPSQDGQFSILQGGMLDKEAIADLLLRGKTPDLIKDPLFPPIAHEAPNKTGLINKYGTIAMGRAEPGSATSEFFINMADNPGLDAGDGTFSPDGKGYAVFGQVIKGMDILARIQRGATLDGKQDQILAEPVKILSAYHRVRSRQH